MSLTIGSLFSGAAGLDMGVEMVFDATPVWFVEFNPAPSMVLAHRYPNVPNLHDVTKVDWTTLAPVDIMTGGFPCQDVSAAGARAGLKDGTRSGLWNYFAVAIDALKPKLVVIENVRGLLSAEAARDVESDPEALGDTDDGYVLVAAGAVAGDLASIGYDARWVTVPASWWGTPHRRERVIFIAYPHGSDPTVLLRHYRGGTGAVVGDVDGALLTTPDTGPFTRGSEHMMTPDIVRLACGDDTVPNPELAGAPKPLLPTPRASMPGSAGEGFSPTLDETVKDLLPTLRATSGRAQGAGFGPMIEDAVFMATGDERTMFKPGMKTLPTPMAKDGDGPSAPGREGSPNLFTAIEELKLMPTPVATDGERGTGGNKSLVGDIAKAATGSGRPKDREKLMPTPLATDGVRQGYHPDVRRDVQHSCIVQMNDLGVAYGEPEWHQYDACIKRWSTIFRPAPYPVVIDEKTGKQQLSPRFSEWMMGWPEGWVDVPGLGKTPSAQRRAQLKICGNGVVPQQAAGAIRIMLSEWVADYLAQ